MTIHESKTTPPRRLSTSQKLALASGAGAALAGALVPQSAEAGIVQSTTLPLSPPSSIGNNIWDVDGDGMPEFAVRHGGSDSTNSAGLFEAPTPANGQLVNPFGKNAVLAKLAFGFAVGSNLPSAYQFNSINNFCRLTISGAIDQNANDFGGWALGDTGYFGFKFENASGIHYGWGQANVHGATGPFVQGQGFTLTQAYYNDTPGASIQVGDTAVPEIDPASAGSVLSLVMGSLAMLERRRLRRAKAADASPTTVSA